MTIDDDIQKAARKTCAAILYPYHTGENVQVIARALQAERDAGKARLREAEELLRKADLWTDEENDVGLWREDARAFLAKEGK